MLAYPSVEIYPLVCPPIDVGLGKLLTRVRSLPGPDRGKAVPALPIM